MPGPDLSWNPERLAGHEWLTPFLEVPDDASPPLEMSPPPADAVGSHGAAAVKWIESSQRIRLRWWQALAITRQLEHREDGSLCHRVVVESAPRRSGKSVRVRGLALWRMAHASLFGEVQTVIHTGSDVAICRDIQRGAWRWAERIAGWTVTQSNGKEAIETPDGDRWLVRAQRAVYGYDCCLGIVDEGWDVAPDTVSEGLEPATLERLSPQLHLTSTAHRRATSLMRTWLKSARSGDDDDTLLLLWSARGDADPGDPGVWRDASPHWSADRRRMIASKFAKALAGEADPQADDPDPMAGFLAQYLNVWPDQRQLDRPIDPAGWLDCLEVGTLDEVRRRVVMVFDVAPSGRHATAYAAAVMPDGRVRIEPVKEWEGRGCADRAARELPALVARVKPRKFGWLPAGPAARVGARIADRATGRREWPPRGVEVEEIRGEVTQVCMGMAELVDARGLVHSGEVLLDDQVDTAERLPRGDAWVFSRKGGDCDALYSAAGAAHLARTLPVPAGPVRVLLPRS